MDPDVRLFKRNILIVEDEYIQAFDYRNELLDRGAEVTGPIATVEDAIERVRQSSPIDAAVVDLNLGGEFSYPLVDELVKRDVPVLFASAYGAEVLPVSGTFQDVRNRCGRTNLLMPSRRSSWMRGGPTAIPQTDRGFRNHLWLLHRDRCLMGRGYVAR